MSKLIRMLPSFLGGIIGAVGFLLVTGAGAKPQAKPVGGIPDVIEAKKLVTSVLEITPREPGGVAGFLSSDASGGVNLLFVGPGSHIFASLSADKDGKSELSLNNASGVMKVVLDSEPSVRVYDDKRVRVAIGQRVLVTQSSGVKETTRPGIVILDEVGRVVWKEPK